MSKFAKDLIASMKQAADHSQGRKVRGMRITSRSGNVFADLGLPNPEQELLKARLTCKSTRSSRRAG